MVDDLGRQRTLGEELLTPTKIYSPDCLALVTECEVRAFAHVTGGGIPGNLSRVLPDALDAVVDRATWRPAPIFDLVQREGEVPWDDMFLTFNMGLGLVAVLSPSDFPSAQALLSARGLASWPVGGIERGDGEASCEVVR